MIFGVDWVFSFFSGLLGVYGEFECGFGDLLCDCSLDG